MTFLKVYIIGAAVVCVFNLLMERLQYGKTCRISEAAERVMASFVLAITWPISLPISLLIVFVHLAP